VISRGSLRSEESSEVMVVKDESSVSLSSRPAPPEALAGVIGGTDPRVHNNSPQRSWSEMTIARVTEGCADDPAHAFLDGSFWRIWPTAVS
jgi:hypothetical protein